MSPHVVRRWCWLLAFLPAFGCTTRDLRTVITEYRPKVEAQLTKLEKIRDAARSAPAVNDDSVHINGPAPKIGITDVDEHANVAVEYLEDLDDLSAFGNVPYRILGSGSMNHCSAILKTHRYPYNPLIGGIPSEIPWYVAESNLKHCEGVRYVFVIRSLEFAGPSGLRNLDGPCPNPSPIADAGVDAGGNATEKCRVFAGGYLSAEVLVFDMTTVSQIGGFRYTAESSPKVDVGTSSDRDLAVASDFALKARVSFQEAAQKYVPGFVVGN